jgi:hypothetical protein
MEWNARIVEDRLEEAAITLRRLPNPAGSGARGFGSSWPDYVREARHAYGYHEAQMRVIPNASEIQRMEDCIDWLRWLDPEDARIVWLRAEGARWRQVCIRAGCVRQTAWRRWAAALLTIAAHLNAAERPKRRTADRQGKEERR